MCLSKAVDNYLVPGWKTVAEKAAKVSTGYPQVVSVRTSQVVSVRTSIE